VTEAAWERECPPISDAAGVRESPDEYRLGAPTRWRVVDALLAIVLLTVLVIAGNLGRMPHGLGEFLAIRITIKSVLLLGAFALVWPRVLSRCGVYSPARLRTGKGEWPRLLLGSAIGGALTLVLPLTSQSGAARPELPLLFAIAFAPAAVALRTTARVMQRTRSGARSRQIIIVGSGPLAARMFRRLLSDPLRADQVVGFVDSRTRASFEPPGLQRLGGVGDLERILMHRVVDGVVICLPIKSHYDEIQQALTACGRVGVPVKYPADLFRSELGVSVSDERAVPPVFYVAAGPNDYRLVIKRAMDLVGAVVLFVLASPVMLGVALLIKLTSAGPLFFAQERYGYMKRCFRMYKFRTMVAGAERMQEELEDRNEATGPAFKIREDPRVTRVGQFLRRSSLDELPQLWHVLTGEMSLVGPRPMAVRDVSRFPQPWLMRRFSVKPGLTCLWQIGGRSDLTFDRWIALDLQYIAQWSLWLDLKVLLRTLPAVFRGAGAM
jgi:exopolysaccharide biosynthesis polyprenyl glycosylphosphotransferase